MSRVRAGVISLILSFVFLYSFSRPALAQEYSVSPNEPWDDISTIPEEPGTSVWRSILFYLPNRFLDLIDIFKADIGLGPSVGAVVRVSKYGQIGVRTFIPGSLRIGLLGRQVPAMLETSGEMGVSPFYTKSRDRKLCSAEVGAGADLFLAGAYLGVCPDEFFDFVGGIFLIDFKDDDFR